MAALVQRPELLWVLLLAPCVGLVLVLLDRVRAQRLVRAVEARVAILHGAAWLRRPVIVHGLFVTGLLFASLALLGPRFGSEADVVEWRGVDLVVCLDVSRSMGARDVVPDRLSRAKSEIGALADRAQGDRLALVVFAGEARLAVPLTRDRATFKALALQADPTDVTKGGTDLGRALETALGALKESGSEHSAIILVTDGEDLGQRGLEAARKCRREGIRVTTFGLGTTLGSKIAFEEEGGEHFLTDRAGQEVVSSLDAAGLRKIAETTGGVYVDVSAGDGALARVHERRTRELARTAFVSAGSIEAPSRFQGPLLIAFALWILVLTLTDRTRR